MITKFNANWAKAAALNVSLLANTPPTCSCCWPDKLKEQDSHSLFCQVRWDDDATLTQRYNMSSQLWILRCIKQRCCTGGSQRLSYANHLYEWKQTSHLKKVESNLHISHYVKLFSWSLRFNPLKENRNSWICKNVPSELGHKSNDSLAILLYN